MVYAAVLPGLAVLLLWIVHVLDVGLSLELNRYGVLPRVAHGLVGVLAAPLLHGDLEHLIGNSVPVFVLGWSLMYFFPDISGRVVGIAWLFTGLGVWVSARANIHIGASGVVYALAAFLFTSGLLRRQRTQMGLAMLVVFLYGSMFWGIFPIVPKVSWESHLWGGIAGVVLALMFRNAPSAVKDPEPVLLDDDDSFDPEGIRPSGPPVIYRYEVAARGDGQAPPSSHDLDPGRTSGTWSAPTGTAPK
jgi:membrane associated rhomboid family serine protease